MRVDRAFSDEVQRWRQATHDVCSTGAASVAAEPRGSGVGALAHAAEGAALHDAVDRLLRRADAVAEHVGPTRLTDSDARTREMRLLVGTVAAAGCLARHSCAGATHDDLHHLIDTAAAAAVDPPNPVVGGDLLDLQISRLQSAVGSELVELERSALTAMCGRTLSGSVNTVLIGAAANHFDDLWHSIEGTSAAHKRGTVRVLSWFSQRVAALIPSGAREQIDHAFPLLDGGLPQEAETIGKSLGSVLGRRRAQEAWRVKNPDDPATRSALGKAAVAVAAELDRLEWIGNGRRVIEQAVTDVLGGESAEHPAAQAAIGCTVASVYCFVAYQLWDGLNELTGLAAEA